LVVDANAELVCPIAMQGLQAIARGRAQVLQLHRIVQHLHLSLCNDLNISETLGTATFKKGLCFGTSE
jgi:hypothetical protein